jgi:hypothetical protein
MKETVMTDTYPYAVDARFFPILVLFGLRAKTDGVALNQDGQFLATFGWFHFATPMSNVEGAHVTNDYRWWTAVGARTSWVDDGLSFGTNTKAGVCVHFKEKVPSLFSRKGHSALTVTVQDVEGLAERLSV